MTKKKWTKAERAEASKQAKTLWAKRKQAREARASSSRRPVDYQKDWGKSHLNVSLADVVPGDLSEALAKHGLVAEPARYGQTVIHPIGVEPNNQERIAIAADVSRILNDGAVSTMVTVLVVERILRP